mgnify:CR=1 FL=1
MTMKPRLWRRFSRRARVRSALTVKAGVSSMNSGMSCSVVAALAFYYLQATDLPELYLIPLKGFGVGFLAIYAWLRHQSGDSHRLALAMAVAAPSSSNTIDTVVEVGRP